MVASDQDLLIYASNVHPSLMKGLIPIGGSSFINCEGKIKSCQELSRTFVLHHVSSATPEDLMENLELTACIVKLLNEHGAVYFLCAGVQMMSVDYKDDTLTCEVLVKYSK